MELEALNQETADLQSKKNRLLVELGKLEQEADVRIFSFDITVVKR